MILPFVALAAGWLGLIVLAPILPIPIAGAIYAIGSFICHQRPERSFHLFTAQLPVCARCAGIYAGVVSGASAAAIGTRIRLRVASARQVRVRVGQASPRALLAASAVPTVLTLVLEWSGLWNGSNVARAAAGLPLGIVVALVVVRAAATLHYGGCAPRRPIANSRPPTHI